MSKDLIKVVQLSEHKPISQMTDAERREYVNELVDGGIFDGVPGLSSDEADAQPEEPTGIASRAGPILRPGLARTPSKTGVRGGRRADHRSTGGCDA